MKKESDVQEGLIEQKQGASARRGNVLSFIIGAAVGIGAGAIVNAVRQQREKSARSPKNDFLNIEQSTKNLKNKLKKSFEDLENQFHEFKEYVSESETTEK